MTPVVVWLAALAAPTCCVALLAGTKIAVERLRAVATGSAGLTLGVAASVFAFPRLAAVRLDWPVARQPWLGDAIVSVSHLSAPLVMLPAALWLVTIAVTPRSRLDRMGLRRTALATLATTYAFLTESPALLALAWIVSNWLFLTALSRDGHRRARRVAGLHVWASTVFLFAGIGLSALTSSSSATTAGLWLILIAVLIRKGIFPFHAWIPEAFDSGRVGPVLLFSAPQLGTYVAAVTVVPHASADMLRVAAILSLVTAVYGAALALVQRDARRAAGYLFVSQSALVLAGLDCTTDEALAGALVIWIASAFAFTGMARTILALEARRGRLGLDHHHGGFEQTPLLAACFLVLGMACTGFPGTLGFVGQEMLIVGAIARFPVLGLLVVAASALTGLAVLRMYFSLFCGRRDTGVRLGLLRREAVAFGLVATMLVVTGLLPGPIVASRLEAAETILAQRRAGPAP